MINTLPKLECGLLVAVLAMMITFSVIGFEVRVETVLVAADAAARGASAAGTKVYRTRSLAI